MNAHINERARVLSAARSVVITLVLAMAGAVMTAGCDGILRSTIAESNTTSGSVGPFVETSSIWLRVIAFYSARFAPGKDGIIIDLKNADTSENLRIGPGDTLQVLLDSVPQAIEEAREVGCSGKIGPCSYMYYYRVVLEGDPDGKPLTISIDRQTGVSSHTTVTYPARPIITAPAAGATVSLSTDALNIFWQAALPPEETRLAVWGECIGGDEYWFLNSGAGSYSIPAGTFAFSTASDFCMNATELPLTIKTDRYVTYAADAALASISSLELYLEHEITVQARP